MYAGVLLAKLLVLLTFDMGSSPFIVMNLAKTLALSS